MLSMRLFLLKNSSYLIHFSVEIQKTNQQEAYIYIYVCMQALYVLISTRLKKSYGNIVFLFCVVTTMKKPLYFWLKD